jgi:hypothetical protein
VIEAGLTFCSIDRLDFSLTFRDDLEVVCRSDHSNSLECSQNVRAKEDAHLIIWLCQGCGVWDCQSGPVNRETSKSSTARAFVIILITKKSWQQGLGQGLLNGCKLRAYL